MTAAMKDLILMVRTGETTESVNYAAIGPRYIAIENPGVDFNHILPRTVVRLFQNSVILLTTAS